MESPTWVKSSFSGDQDAPNCLEVAHGSGDGLLLRESEAPDVTLAFGAAGFGGLVRYLKDNHG